MWSRICSPLPTQLGNVQGPGTGSTFYVIAESDSYSRYQALMLHFS